MRLFQCADHLTVVSAQCNFIVLVFFLHRVADIHSTIAVSGGRERKDTLSRGVRKHVFGSKYGRC